MKQFKRSSGQIRILWYELILIAIGQIILCVELAGSVQDNGISVEIMSDPPGPSFPAATWIRFTCAPNDYNSSDTLMYTWTGACNGTGERVFEVVDPYLDGEGHSVVWIPSTAHYCLDRLECHIVDFVTKKEGNALFIIEDVNGVGVAIKDRFLGSIPNNSIIISSGSQDTVNILCHSASKNACSGQWLRVGEEGTVQASNASSECSSLLYSYANLTFERGQGESGVYKCIMNDENNVLQSIFIAIYSTMTEVEHKAEHVRVTLDYILLEDNRVIAFYCNMEGLLVTSTTWTKDGVSTVDNNGLEQMDTLVDQHHSSYLSELTIHGANLSSLRDSVLVCDVYSDWVLTDQSNFGWQHVSGEFVIKQVGDVALLECVFPPNHISTKWILPSVLENSTTYLQAPNSASLLFSVTDSLHKASFTCQASTPRGSRVYKHYMLITYLPGDAITITITEHNYINQDKDTTDPSHLNISCCASIEVSGITSRPVITWHNSHGAIIANGGNFHVQETVGENNYCAMLQFPSEACGDELTCKATLMYDVDSAPLVKTMGYSIIRSTMDTQGEHAKEVPLVTFAIIGVAVTVVSVSILVATTAVLTCAVMSLLKKRRQAIVVVKQESIKEEMDNGSLEMKT